MNDSEKKITYSGILLGKMQSLSNNDYICTCTIRECEIELMLYILAKNPISFIYGLYIERDKVSRNLGEWQWEKALPMQVLL